MSKLSLSIAIALVPAMLPAQVTAKAQAQSRTEAHVSNGSTDADASAATSVDAEIAAARKRNLPTRPIERRAAEGRAKGASETQIALAARRVRANMEAAHEAMVSAGRRNPGDEEVERGASVIEQGYTRAHLQAVAKSAPGDRSLVVAFDVLARLAARGVPVARALAQVRSNLESRASDAEIAALVSADASVNGGAGLGRGVGAGANATGTTAAGVATKGASGAASVAGSATGAVGAVIKKP